LIEDVYEPLERYRDEFREKFSRLTAKTFADLVAASGVDQQLNIATIAEIRRSECQQEKAQRRRSFWLVLVVLAVLASILAAVYAFYAYLAVGQLPDGGSAMNCYLRMAGGGFFALALGYFNYKYFYRSYRRAVATIDALLQHIEQKKADAWRQMAPLNQLFDWDITGRLIEQTVPRIQFDPYFTDWRLQELQQSFGWDDSFNDHKSVLCAQSGEINGNPFVFGQLRTMHWGEKTYTGTKNISWSVRVRGTDGKYHSMRRYQTLVASVTKPLPVYDEEKFLLYGNDAAPNLTFSRTPSELSGSGNGFVNAIRKKLEKNKLESFSRNLDDESQYTMMNNHDFEILFHAIDRNHEVEFRLLFTDLAQQQMLKLLQDRIVGFGDDFSFVKHHKVNLIYAQHLNNISLDTDPRRFADYDLNRAMQIFQKTNEDYFKAVFFALAPLLAIPLYQQTRTHAAIYNGIVNNKASFWEYESLANYHGEQKFQHPQCITSNILKTQFIAQERGVSSVAVTALGYKGVSRVESQSVFGGDGRYHNIRVEWTEYLPVQKTANIFVSEQGKRSQPDEQLPIPEAADKWQEFFRAWGTDQQHCVYRRSILSFLKGK